MLAETEGISSLIPVLGFSFEGYDECRLAARGGGLKLLSLSFHTEPVGDLDEFASGHPGDQITRGSGPLSYFASVILHRRALVIKSYVTAIVNGLSCDRRVASRHEKGPGRTCQSGP